LTFDFHLSTFRLIRHQINPIFPILLFPFHHHFLIVDGIYLATAVIGLYGQMSTEPTIYENEQLNLRRTTKRLYGRKRRADTASGIQNIIYKNDFLVFYKEIDFGGIGFERLLGSPKIIAVKRDIQVTQGDAVDMILVFEYAFEPRAR
jgi:hypothetical protein